MVIDTSEKGRFVGVLAGRGFGGPASPDSSMMITWHLVVGAGHVETTGQGGPSILATDPASQAAIASARAGRAAWFDSYAPTGDHVRLRVRELTMLLMT